jgi:hypothetical protein
MLPMASSHPNLRVVAWRDSKQASSCGWAQRMDHHAFPPKLVKLQKGFCLNVGKGFACEC